LENDINNFLLSRFLLACVLGVVIVNQLTSSKQFTTGQGEQISCSLDRKRENTYSFTIQFENGDSFSNQLNIPCESISEIKKGDWIEIESYDHTFMQIIHKEQQVFDKNALV